MLGWAGNVVEVALLLHGVEVLSFGVFFLIASLQCEIVHMCTHEFTHCHHVKPSAVPASCIAEESAVGEEGLFKQLWIRPSNFILL